MLGLALKELKAQVLEVASFWVMTRSRLCPWKRFAAVVGGPVAGRLACWLCHPQVFTSPVEKTGVPLHSVISLGHFFPIL